MTAVALKLVGSLAGPAKARVRLQGGRHPDCAVSPRIAA